MSLPEAQDEMDARSTGLPRVLFVSVNPFSATSNNGKTFASFFEGYPKDSLAQLYFHREIPTSPVCDRYFRITDEQLLRSRGRLWRVSGERVSAESPSTTPIPARTHAALKGSRTIRLLRQLVWTTVSFDDTALLTWLDEFRPQIVFFCGGDAAALYPKVTSLSERYGARPVLYVTDDYVLPIPSRNVSALLMRRWTRRAFTRFAQQAALVLTIGDAMSDAYAEAYGIESTPVMNMVHVPAVRPVPRVRASHVPLELLYAGSLHSNRWRVLGLIVESCERLAKRGIEIRLRLVGPEPAPKERLAVHRLPYGRHDGLLPPRELRLAIAGSDTLVHVESGDANSMAVTALSVSTKIPEYLASGRSVLAIGPRGVASIDYLDRHEAAVVLQPDDTEGLDRALTALASRPRLHHELAERGFALARQNHDGPQTRRLLWARLREMTS